MFKSLPKFKEIESVKIMYNVGCLMDIPTGHYVQGIHGESILNGGLGALTLTSGRGNSFKSTIMHYMLLSAAEKIAAANYTPYMSTYDTEINIQRDRLQSFVDRFPHLKKLDILNTHMWSITDKTEHMGNEWYELLKDFLNNDKYKNKKDYLVKTPFITSLGEQIMTIFPTFGEIDSISEFETADIAEIQNKNELGESGGNTMYMRMGLAKTRLMMELPTICNKTGHYMIMTSHIGTEIAMQSGPYNQPTKKTQHMKQGEKVKGISDKFLFLTNSFWNTTHTSTLNNQTTKGPEYPAKRGQTEEGSTDLNIVTLKQVRNKSGPSGYTIDVVVSQTEGVLPSLTEFVYIKDNDRFGINGSLHNYELDLLPGVKLSRTTIRELIDSNPEVRRAIKITADLLQIKHFYRHLDIHVPTPAELYETLKSKYVWKVLLDTRDWWTFNNSEVKPNFLSTMDLVRMNNGDYTPFWMEQK